MRFLRWLSGKFHDLTCVRLTIGDTSIGEQDLLRLLHPLQSTGPLSFRLTDLCGEKALHLDSASSLNFQIHNTTSSPIPIQKLSGSPSRSNCQFYISYQDGLHWSHLSITSPSSWIVATDTDDFGTTYLCFLFLGSEDTSISAQGSITLQLAYSGLEPDGETSATLDAKCYSKKPESSQSQSLALVKGGVGGLAPLWADFGGRRTVLNDGSLNDAVLRLTNLSTAGPISFTAESEIAIRFDIDNSAKPPAWALGNTNQVSKIDIAPPPGWSRQSNAGQIWKFRPTAATSLQAGEALEFTLSSIATNFPPGLTNVYVDLHQLPCYGDGTLVAQLEKSPLAYNPASGTGMALRGTTQGKALAIQTTSSDPALLVESKGSKFALIQAFSPSDPFIEIGVDQDTCWGIGVLAGPEDMAQNNAFVISPRETNVFPILITQHRKVGIMCQEEPQALLHVGGDCQIDGPLTVGKDLAVSGRISDKTGPVMPVASVLPFAGANPPAGWLLCDGKSYDKARYPDLFGVIGTIYGGGGATFNVPDLRGRGPMGYKGSSSFDPLGKTGGEATHTLTIAEMPAHNHAATFSSNQHINYSEDYDGSSYLHGEIRGSAAPSQSYPVSGSATVAIGSTGGGGAHNNLQPFLTLNFVIKT